MIDLNKAVEIARELGAEHGIVHEWTKAFIFATDGEEFGQSPCVVLKESGDAIHILAWLSSEERAQSEYIRSYELRDDGTWQEFIELGEQ